MSLLQDTGIVVTACFRARSIHPLWLPDTNQQSYFSNEFISLLLFLGLHWFLPHRWFPGLFWVRRCHCRLKWVKVQKSGLSTCQPSQFYLYSPKSQSLLPWKASLVLRHTGKKENQITDVVSNSTIINALLSFTANLLDVTLTLLWYLSWGCDIQQSYDEL